MVNKYRQHGYMDYEREDRQRSSGPPRSAPKPRDGSEGPRSPQMTGTKTVARCYNCGVILPALSEQLGECGKCNSSLRCCKMCTHFDPASQFECTQPIEVRVAPKDRYTSCEHFSLKTTVEKDTSGVGASPSSSSSPDGARKAFENLFKK